MMKTAAGSRIIETPGGFPDASRRIHHPLGRHKRERRCSSKSPSSSDDGGGPVIFSPISHLCDSIVIHILQRLPNPRSLYRCKPVCKRWNSLVSDPNLLPHLVSLHKVNLGGGGEDGGLIYYDRPGTQKSILTRMLTRGAETHLQVLATCYDLVLCGSIFTKNRYGRRFYICNPFTKQRVSLPIVPHDTYTSTNGFCFGTHRLGVPIYEVDFSMVGFVCEPYCIPSSYGGNIVVQKNHNYRFRVAVLFCTRAGIFIDSFHSESGEWKNRYLCYDYGFDHRPYLSSTCPYIAINAPSTSIGKIFWKTQSAHLAALDLFDDQGFPFLIDCSHVWSHDIVKHNFLVGMSRGILRGMVFPRPHLNGGEEGLFSMWILEEDQQCSGGYQWNLAYEVPMQAVYNIVRQKMMRKKDLRLGVLGVHPSRPEVVYFECREHGDSRNHDPFFFDFNYHLPRHSDGDAGGETADHHHGYDPIYVVACDLHKRELFEQEEIIPLADSYATRLKFKYWGYHGIGDPLGWGVFQPVIPFWPTPLPEGGGGFGKEVVREKQWDKFEMINGKYVLGGECVPCRASYNLVD